MHSKLNNVREIPQHDLKKNHEKKIENITLNDKNQIPSPPKYQESENIHTLTTSIWHGTEKP